MKETISARQKKTDDDLTKKKLCKKVAELAQVVHLLFMSNHEKQIEIDCLIDAYEDEISRVIDDAQTWVKSSENAIAEQKKRVEESAAELGHARHHLELLRGQYDQVKEKESRQSNELSEVKEECQKLRDLLINDQSDLQRLKANLESELKEKEQVLNKRNEDLERMSQKIARLETTLMDVQRNADRTVKMAQKRVRNVEQELNRMRLEVKSAHRNRDSLFEKQKTLEKELKDYQKTAENRIAELLASYNLVKSEEQLDSSNNNKDFELNLLKKELQRYRLELSNRDKNFSQMFVPISHCTTDITQRGTLIVDRRAGLLARQFAVSQEGYETLGCTGKIPPLHGERQLSFAYNNNYRENQSLLTNFPPKKSAEEKTRGARFSKHSQAVSFRGK